jgi:dethiobiotin synthetase
MLNHIFITGIDTDCGKTYITGLVAYHLKRLGVSCITSKLVQTGCSGIAEDIIEHRKTMEIDILPEDSDGLTCPFVYTFPASPHLSADIDLNPFDIRVVEQSINKLISQYDIVLTEGTGGLAVPLNHRMLTADYLSQSQIPVILVSSSRLGSLNHTVLSIDYCKNSNIRLTSVIYNHFPNENKKIADDSFQFIKNYLKKNYPKIKLVHSSDLQKGSNINVVELFM